MSNTITIDLDSLSKERAHKLAGFILTYASLDDDEAEGMLSISPQSGIISIGDKVTGIPNVPLATIIAREEPSPAEVFGNISTAGPQLVIPNPPSPVINAPINSPVPQVAGDAVGIQQVATSTGIVVDKSGLPWDSRIHSGSKAFNADGTWRSRRGLVEGYATQIEAELRQLMAIPSPSVPASIPPVAPAPTAAVSSSAANIPLPPATASPSIQPYLDLMNKVSSALAGGRISQPQLQKVCDGVGLPNFVSLGTRLDLVPTVSPMIDGILAGTAV